MPGLADYPGGGAGLIMDTIDNNFGIQIDHYMVMDWVDFMDIINELGGVDINVPEYAYDPAYADCSYCGDVYSVEFVPGPEHMDGVRALAYARIRKSDNDFKRIERQQLVLKAMAAKASIGTILDNPIGLYNQFQDAVKSDVSPGRAGALGLLYRDIQKNATEQGLEPIRTISMAPATYPCATCSYAGLNYDPIIAQELIAQVFSDARVVQESASVEVLNATPTPDLAAAFKDYMQTKGIAPEQDQHRRVRRRPDLPGDVRHRPNGLTRADAQPAKRMAGPTRRPSCHRERPAGNAVPGQPPEHCSR